MISEILHIIVLLTHRKFVLSNLLQIMDSGKSIGFLMNKIAIEYFGENRVMTYTDNAVFLGPVSYDPLLEFSLFLDICVKKLKIIKYLFVSSPLGVHAKIILIPSGVVIGHVTQC